MSDIEAKTQRDTKPAQGGRPTLPLEQRRAERISFGVTKAQKARFLVSAAHAGVSSNDYARAMLCDRARAGAGQSCSPRAPDFELIDTLGRIGADLSRLRYIADETGSVPDVLDDVLVRLNRKIDHLIVGSRMADELAQHRAKLIEIAEKLEARQAMTERARGMITTFDRVVTKVLSA